MRNQSLFFSWELEICKCGLEANWVPTTMTDDELNKEKRDTAKKGEEALLTVIDPKLRRKTRQTVQEVARWKRALYIHNINFYDYVFGTWTFWLIDKITHILNVNVSYQTYNKHLYWNLCHKHFVCIFRFHASCWGLGSKNYMNEKHLGRRFLLWRCQLSHNWILIANIRNCKKEGRGRTQLMMIGSTSPLMILHPRSHMESASHCHPWQHWWWQVVKRRGFLKTVITAEAMLQSDRSHSVTFPGFLEVMDFPTFLKKSWNIPHISTKVPWGVLYDQSKNRTHCVICLFLVMAVVNLWCDPFSPPSAEKLYKNI